MLTPQEMAEDCWGGLELGPGWEKRLTAAIVKQIKMAIADERKQCAGRAWRVLIEYGLAQPVRTAVTTAIRDTEQDPAP